MEKFTLQIIALRMPCCKHELHWIGTTLPIYCPKCGTKTTPDDDDDDGSQPGRGYINQDPDQNGRC
jgi:hypothetical protein